MRIKKKFFLTALAIVFLAPPGAAADTYTRIFDANGVGISDITAEPSGDSVKWRARAVTDPLYTLPDRLCVRVCDTVTIVNAVYCRDPHADNQEGMGALAFDLYGADICLEVVAIDVNGNESDPSEFVMNVIALDLPTVPPVYNRPPAPILLKPLGD